MAQPSVTTYFNVRKRPAVDELKINIAKKILLDSDSKKGVAEISRFSSSKIVEHSENMNKISSCVVSQIVKNSKELSLAQIKAKLTSSSRLAELKQSINSFKNLESKTEALSKKNEEIQNKLNVVVPKTVEFEINVSPQKPHSPIKAYLSPKKDLSPCKKLFNITSPIKKSSVARQLIPTSPLKTSVTKQSLPLPMKYIHIAEIFRSVDTISQLLFNRKETITFKKLKLSVEEMLKRNLTEKHLAQIKFLYPDAFEFRYEKVREFGVGMKKENWQLVIHPQIQNTNITPEILLERRRKLYNTLIAKLKTYHSEFLLNLDPPVKIPEEKQLTAWHHLFDIQSVPEIETSRLPTRPNQETFTKGSEVLEKAKSLFQCNTRMEKALEKLKQSDATAQVIQQPSVAPQQPSLLKGIPQALLDKVREKQAAKALEAMTRSSDKEKEARLYSHLPEIARLTRNLFVSEKKNVLPLDVVLEKLRNSYKVFSSKSDLNLYLETISKEIGDWLVFHNIRGLTYLKLSKNSDLNSILDKLNNLAEAKNA